MDEKENTGTESSAVTAIKVKVVIDTNKKELDQQFNSVKEHYKEKPVKIAFGVNQNDTIRNINDALDKVVKSGKLKTPKVTLDVKIDQSKVTAQLKKAMQSAAKQTVKVDTGKSSSAKTDTTGASEIKQLEKFVEQAKAKTTEWKSSIKGTTEEAKKIKFQSSEYSQFSDRAAKTARDLGASISDYVSATADWSRLGYNMPDAEELARVSTLLKNVGDGIESVTDASSYMISVLKGFDLAAEDAQKVADLVNEVANNEPASAEDILEILTRSGAALHEAGNDLDQAVALGVAMNSVTQNAESTGQTLKTVSMYLRAAKTDLTAMGESTDGCANSVSELRSELKKLTGVDIMADAAGTQFKSTYDILMEISKVWGKLTDVDRANVTKLLGGKRNANSVSAVLSQFQIAEKSMKDAANSAGSAAKENEVYLTSITGKLNQLDAAFQQFSKDLLDSSLIKFFVDFATGAVDLADGAVKAAGTLPTLTAAISGVLSVMQMSGKLKNGAGKVNMPSYICCV